MTGFFRHIFKLFHWRRIGGRAFAGLVLVAVNVPFGYGGAALCTLAAGRCPQWRLEWMAGAAAVYALSWLMLLGGTLLAGPAAVRSFRQRLPAAWRAWRRIRGRRQ